MEEIYLTDMPLLFFCYSDFLLFTDIYAFVQPGPITSIMIMDGLNVK